MPTAIILSLIGLIAIGCLWQLLRNPPPDDPPGEGPAGPPLGDDNL